MSTEQHFWREFVLVVGGVALVASAQVHFIEPTKASHVIWTWSVHALFGALYALIGSATTYMAISRQRDSKMPGTRSSLKL